MEIIARPTGFLFIFVQFSPWQSMKCAVAGADNYQTGDSRGQEISIKKQFIMSGSEYYPRAARVDSGV